MNENAIETIVQWFWEPLSNECKEVIKGAKDYNTIEGFLSAIFRYNFRYIFNRLDIDDEMYLSDKRNLGQIVDFIERFGDKLLELEIRF